jgi:hypothetical protein
VPSDVTNEHYFKYVSDSLQLPSPFTAVVVTAVNESEHRQRGSGIAGTATSVLMAHAMSQLDPDVIAVVCNNEYGVK